MLGAVRYLIPSKLKLNWYIADNECLVFSESSCQLHLMSGFQGYILNLFSEKPISVFDAIELVKETGVGEGYESYNLIVEESIDFLFRNNLIENIDS